MSRHLDAFNGGYLREAAAIWDLLEERDDLIRAVVSKRKKSVARQGYTVLLNEDLLPAQKAEAREHAGALEFFYRNLECENAIDSCEKGGFKLLIRQMMDAVGKRFAVHEIVWRKLEVADRGMPGAGGKRLSATFRFVPLGFFENTTGRLRFLDNATAREGKELEEGAWLVTVGEGLMAATSTAWMLKHMSLNDWLIYSERNGKPVIRGISSAAEDSPEWERMEQAVEAVMMGTPVVHGTADDIKVIDLAAGGQIPFPELVERMDRMIAILWRGADLSTLSRDRGYGASLQEKETCALEEDDAEMLTETLNRYVDAWVIRYLFGEEVKPLARVKVLSSPRECTATDLQVDEFLLRHGAPLSLESTLNRYGRVLPKRGEELFPVEAARPLSNREALASRSESSHELEEGMGNEGEHSGGVDFRSDSGLREDGEHMRAAAREGEEPVLPLNNECSIPCSPLPREFRADLENSGDEWVQLSPYGDFPHARGLQRVNREAAEGMAANFARFSSRLGRLFGGIPFFVGHPDLPQAHELADRKAYGWAGELAAREDGMYARVKWSEAGLELLKNGHFKFLSPYWEARPIGNEEGRKVFQPVALLSVGLTNTPNLPVKALANESGESPAQPVESGQNQTPPSSGTVLDAPLHTVALTAELGGRKAESARFQNRRESIQEAVLRKMRLGLGYDEAWAAVKRENASWFEPSFENAG
jgi:hypothetical protein